MKKIDKIITRFAPSPSGYLHKGHAYSALAAYKKAVDNNGRFLLRIEDIDVTRCKSEFIQPMLDDLKWLGLKWEEPVRRQSEHFDDYQAALEQLKDMGVVYPCFCTRKEIKAEIEKSPSAPHDIKKNMGPDGYIYPGICKGRKDADDLISSGKDHAWRLDLDAALALIGDKGLTWQDEIKGTVTATPEILGDVILARKDTPTSYHLSVVVDDALQGITHIVRGEDLFHATHIHIVLQNLLGLPIPIYHHHELLLDEHGKRFAKRDKAQTIKSLRESGVSVQALFN